MSTSRSSKGDRGRLAALYLLLSALVTGVCLAQAAAEPATSPFLVASGVPYVEAGDPRLQSLDVYAPPDAEGLPVLVYAHGGALYGGDKTEVGEKPAFFCERGWVLVSFNYRLSPAVRHPDHLIDSAAALAWVARNIESHGGDPDRIVLVGHSAGAFLGALLAVDHRRLELHGLGLDALKAVVLLDGVEYSLDERIRELSPQLPPEVLAEIHGKVGSDPEGWRDATAMRHIAANKGIPPILLVAAGIQFQHWIPGREPKIFLAALMEAGVEAEYYLAPDKNHGQVNADLTSGDALSRTVLSFLERYVKREPALAAAAAKARDVHELTFPSVDGKSTRAVLSLPEGPGPHPVVVTVHGGNGDRSYEGLRQFAAPESNSALVRSFNSKPWAVFAVDFRHWAVFGLEREDVIAGIRFIAADPRIDPERIAVMGSSHGGHIALLVAQALGPTFDCVAVGSPAWTNPHLYLYGSLEEPPLSRLSEAARGRLLELRALLLEHLERMEATGVDTKARLREYDIEENAAKIVIPSLFLTSRSDIPVPHSMVSPTIVALGAAGRAVRAYLAELSGHEYYWSRDTGAQTASKTAEMLAEEAEALTMTMDFLETCLAP